MSFCNTRAPVGIALGTSQYEAEANAYLQSRLRIWYAVALATVGGLYLVGLAEVLAGQGWYDSVLNAASLIHLGSLFIVAVCFGLLWGRPYRGLGLRIFDALGIELAIATCLVIYAIMFQHGPRLMSGLIALFIVTRAVVVPSQALRTLLLSIPAPLGFLVIQLANETHYLATGIPYPPEDVFSDVILWDQVMLWLGIFIASVASYVNFSLRKEVTEARQLGQYQIEEKIGEGGMGEIYRATHAMLRRPTAIKLLRPEITGEEAIRRFEREVRQTSRLSHPNTVAIFDYGRTPDGVFYYAMEYLDGADLKEIVERTGPMPVARAIHVLRQACGALHEAHELGLIHRDLKPGNLLLCSRGGIQDVTKVVDFGLVKDIQQSDRSLTQLGTICGTPETIAPEVLGGADASPSSDLYALAAVGYYVLTGKPIFEATTLAEFVGHHLHSEPVPMRDRDPSLPEDVEAVVMRCLRKEPADRPTGAAELRAELGRCADWGKWTEEQAASWWEGFAGRGG